MSQLARWITLALLVTAALGMLVGYKLGRLDELEVAAAATEAIDCTARPLPPTLSRRDALPAHPDDMTTLRAYARRPASTTVITDATPARDPAITLTATTLTGSVVSRMFPDGAVSIILNPPQQTGSSNTPGDNEKLKQRAAALARRMAHCLLN